MTLTVRAGGYGGPDQLRFDDLDLPAPRPGEVRIRVDDGTPDHRPVLGAVRDHPGVFLGIYPYMGFTASPLMGRTLTALALGEDPGRDLTPFAPERFAASETSAAEHGVGAGADVLEDQVGLGHRDVGDGAEVLDHEVAQGGRVGDRDVHLEVVAAGEEVDVEDAR